MPQFLTLPGVGEGGFVSGIPGSVLHVYSVGFTPFSWTHCASNTVVDPSLVYTGFGLKLAQSRVME